VAAPYELRRGLAPEPARLPLGEGRQFPFVSDTSLPLNLMDLSRSRRSLKNELDTVTNLTEWLNGG